MSDAGLFSIGYIILTDGARHTKRPLGERLGAAAQMNAIEAFSRRMSHREVVRWFDYARAAKGPADFQNLFEILRRLEQHGAGGILLDGAERLFRRLPAEGIGEMYSMLELHRGRIVDIRRGRHLSKLNDKEWFAVGYAGLFKPKRSPRVQPQANAPKNTAKARHVSKLARGKKADVAARAVLDLRKALECGGDAPSNMALAREANARGLRTSRGNEWSDVAVARALKRLAGRDAEN